MKPARRDFLRRASALTAGGLAANLDLFGLHAWAQTAQPDYKALVCVFLFGGFDGNNTVVPLDNTGYGQYAAVRTTASGINIPQANLLPIQPSNSTTPFGLHPLFTGLQTLFNEGKMAIVANVGTLVQPITKAQYVPGLIPTSLYSHSDQQVQWQSSISDSISRTGWGGRIADAMAGSNAGSPFPTVTSLAGTALFINGSTGTPLALPSSGSFGLSGTGTSTSQVARFNALNAILGQDRSNELVAAAADITKQAIDLSSMVNGIVSNANSSIRDLFTVFPSNNSIAQQLYQIAKLIEARGTTGAKRQVFFASLGGFDTHGNQTATLDNLYGQLVPALKAFYDATARLGVANQVTSFTLSDFGRTLQPASGGGTDHAWGNHQFVCGGAVKGGALYGSYPTLALGGPDDAEKRGRWIPTLAVDQMGATLARWFGVSESNLASVFPNLHRFASSDLGFMNLS
ncbi:hypothetical protein BURK2_00629 [Burkholderiales bacterium]|nr:MAG: DUF1501 domain-containing protein [Burkholderiales bacterium]CAG0959084.1 hypothetical protein BURK2_00629 [Burkholderiales bacterium]